MGEAHDTSDLDEATRLAALRAELSRTTVEGQGRVASQIPPRAIAWVVVAILVLGGGGALGEHFLGRIGAVTPTTLTTMPAGAGVVTPNSIGVKVIEHARAAGFSLRASGGGTWGLSDSRGHVTVVTFFGVSCRDVCAVEGVELKAALADLGPAAAAVSVDIVNTEPGNLNPGPRPPALVATGLAGRSNVHFLSGSLAALTRVWSAYGVQVRVGSTPGEVAHNDALYFVDRAGHLVGFVVPLTRESLDGNFTLASADAQRFARGLAAEIVSVKG
jgi:cytochrome oxidase Cu insertion factor (SCO1/SenC/PrrC family)